jgi:enterochelin esterase-like enzyme
MSRWFITLLILLMGGYTSPARSALAPPLEVSSFTLLHPPATLELPRTITSQPPILPTRCYPASCQATSRRLDVLVPSQTLGQNVPVRIFLPPDQPCDTAGYPVIYLFHGANTDESQWDDVQVDEAADAGRAKGTLPPVILVLPRRLNDNTLPGPGGDLPFEHFVITELIPWVEQHTPARPDREHRAIGGISRGGFWALEIAFHHPELFSEVGGHSPVVGQKEEPFSPLGLATTMATKLRSLRVWLDVGTEDSLKNGTADLAANLTAARVPVTFEQWPGGHNRPYWRRHAADYLAFYTALWGAATR